MTDFCFQETSYLSSIVDLRIDSFFITFLFSPFEIMSNRKSNGELLRILSSLGVITCHFFGTCGPIEINERRIPDMKT